MEKEKLTLDEFLEFSKAKIETHKKDNHTKLGNLLFIVNKMVVDIMFLIENNNYQSMLNEYVISQDEIDKELVPMFNKFFEFTNRIILHYRNKQIERGNKSYDEIIKEEEELLIEK